MRLPGPKNPKNKQNLRPVAKVGLAVGATPKLEKLSESGQTPKSTQELGTSGTLGSSKGSSLTRGDILLDAHAIERARTHDVKNTALVSDRSGDWLQFGDSLIDKSTNPDGTEPGWSHAPTS